MFNTEKKDDASGDKPEADKEKTEGDDAEAKKDDSKEDKDGKDRDASRDKSRSDRGGDSRDRDGSRDRRRSDVDRRRSPYRDVRRDDYRGRALGGRPPFRPRGGGGRYDREQLNYKHIKV